MLIIHIKHQQMVVEPAWRALPPLGLRYAAALAGVPGQLTGLLDTRPLASSLTSNQLLDWEQIGKNLQEATIDALAVITTECETGRTKVFYEGAATVLGGVPDTDDERAMDYVRGELTAEHIRASVAIPILFPPVRLDSGTRASWHMDGGVRLNAPLKPAIALGARRLVVVATDPPYYRPSSAAAERPPPSIQDATSQLLHGAMTDRMIEDLIVLAKMNKLVQAGGAGATSRSGRLYQVIPFVFGGPETYGTVGAKAEEVLVHGRRDRARPAGRRGARPAPATVEGRRVPAQTGHPPPITGTWSPPPALLANPNTLRALTCVTLLLARSFVRSMGDIVVVGDRGGLCVGWLPGTTSWREAGMGPGEVSAWRVPGCWAPLTARREFSTLHAIQAELVLRAPRWHRGLP